MSCESMKPVYRRLRGLRNARQRPRGWSPTVASETKRTSESDRPRESSIIVRESRQDAGETEHGIMEASLASWSTHESHPQALRDI